MSLLRKITIFNIVLGGGLLTLTIWAGAPVLIAFWGLGSLAGAVITALAEGGEADVHD